ncbi:MAG: ABC transporter permease [Candidatus Thiodiazotropha sp.]|jgi:ABC-2 type transport system permease protein
MLFTVVQKEIRLVLKDPHALLVLFLLPVVFILIMSLALQDRMGGENREHPKVGLWIEDPASLEPDLRQAVTALEGLQVISVPKHEQLLRQLDNGDYLAAIELPRGFSNSLTSPDSPDTDKLQIRYAASLPASLRRSILGSVREALGAAQVRRLFTYDDISEAERQTRIDHLLGRTLVVTRTQGDIDSAPPNSVQQSVPAWLIFSMYFVVLPIATTLLTERQQGTLQRLRTLPVPGSILLAGKLIPYLIINLIQAGLMLLVGTHLVPLLTGEGLHLTGAAWLLLPLILAVSLSAISFALLIATRARTSEQATTLGGISNLILAAIGGIMVPTFVMPELMQHIAALSPMNWALEGFFAVLLRQGGWSQVGPEILKLLLLSGILFSLALYFYRDLADGKT